MLRRPDGAARAPPGKIVGAVGSCACRDSFRARRSRAAGETAARPLTPLHWCAARTSNPRISTKQDGLSSRRPRPAIMTDASRLLNAIEQGNAQAAARLLPLVYDEFGAWPRLSLPANARDRRSARRPWSTRRTCVCGLPCRRAREGSPLGRPGPLLRRRGRSDAAHPGREPRAQATSAAWRRLAAHPPRWRRAGRRNPRR